MVKNIIFDLGGVLIDWNPKNVFRTIFPTEKEVDLFLSNICTMEWNIQQDAGRPLQEATLLLQKKYPEWYNEIESYYQRWEEMLSGPINGTVDILEKAIKNPKYKVVALTNWSAETFPIAQKKYKFLDWFEGIVVSGEEKCIKPYEKIYNIILNRFNLKPEESLFIDDNLDNIKTAQSMGIKCHHFTSSDKLELYFNEHLF